MIDRLLESKLRGRDLSDRTQWDKAGNALFRRGYSWNEIRAAMERYRE
jgi:SOS response regulatory protein OraA/RecX